MVTVGVDSAGVVSGTALASRGDDDPSPTLRANDDAGTPCACAASICCTCAIQNSVCCRMNFATSCACCKDSSICSTGGSVPCSANGSEAAAITVGAIMAAADVPALVLWPVGAEMTDTPVGSTPLAEAALWP